MEMRRPRRVSLVHRGGGAAAPGYRVIARFIVTVPKFIQIAQFRDDFFKGSVAAKERKDGLGSLRSLAANSIRLRLHRVTAQPTGGHSWKPGLAMPKLCGSFRGMSFPEVLAELSSMSVAQRQLLVRRALELDEPVLSAEDEALVEQRLAEHRRNPASALSLDEMKSRIRARISP